MYYWFVIKLLHLYKYTSSTHLKFMSISQQWASHSWPKTRTGLHQCMLHWTEASYNASINVKVEKEEMKFGFAQLECQYA